MAYRQEPRTSNCRLIVGDYGGFVGGENPTLHGATAFGSMGQVQRFVREHVEQAVPQSTFSLPGGLLSREMFGGGFVHNL